ncbi:hypothetical protein [Chryseobacterium sp. HMWF035]|uniref:hypothetical protein n=2 Tax=unclassified Chryseobacterium TaxID=2593645 RepID=UPI000D344EAB|nr:hypothetical protein [Chryseobacterium sp. HMWF035]PTT74096.1 hypothetical protein DBR25_11635 [Chryseobacterium sp. HMWF001]
MTKKMISWLALVAVFLVSYSCRNDMLPEKEIFENSSQFQLTSRRMSLAESKHRLKLMPEISEAQTLLRSSQYNVSGKTVNAGSGVTINTNDVIYIENGPNYHTYTFSIVRENAPIDAPVENLVLTPLPDGTYKGLLFRYNFTQQEKQNIMDGIPMDTKGKTTITEAGTNITLSKVQECSYVEETIWQDCSQHIHNQSNISDWVNCTAEIKPQVYTIGYWSCSSGGGGGNEGGSGNTGSDDGTGGGNAGNDNCITEVFQNPLDPVAVYNPCPIGVPTSPNIPNLSNPCEKTKNMLKDPKVQLAIDDITKQAKKAALDINEGEIGRIEKNGMFYPADVSEDHHVIFNNIAGAKGAYHNHTYKGAKIHSPKDIFSILSFAHVQPTVANYGDAYIGMIGAEKCYPDVSGCFRMFHYIIRFGGITADLSKNFTEDEMKKFNKDYRDREHELAETLPYVNFLGDITLNKKGYEKLFFETLHNMGLSGKVILQRVDDDGTVNNINLDANGIPEAIPCPQL